MLVRKISLIFCLLFTVMATTSFVSAQDADTGVLSLSSKDSANALHLGVVLMKTNRLSWYLDSLGYDMDWEGHRGYFRLYKKETQEKIIQFFVNNGDVNDVTIDQQGVVRIAQRPYIYCGTGELTDGYLSLSFKNSTRAGDETGNSTLLVIEPKGKIYFEICKVSGEKIRYNL